MWRKVDILSPWHILKKNFSGVSNEAEIHPKRKNFYASFLFFYTRADEKVTLSAGNAEISPISGLATRNLFFTCVCLFHYFYFKDFFFTLQKNGIKKFSIFFSYEILKMKVWSKRMIQARFISVEYFYQQFRFLFHRCFFFFFFIFLIFLFGRMYLFILYRREIYLCFRFREVGIHYFFSGWKRYIFELLRILQSSLIFIEWNDTQFEIQFSLERNTM